MVKTLCYIELTRIGQVRGLIEGTGFREESFQDHRSSKHIKTQWEEWPLPKNRKDKMEPCGRRLWSSDLIWYTFRKRFSSWEQWLRELEWLTILIENYRGRNGIREADGEAVRVILGHRVRTLIMGMEKILDIGNKDLWRANVLLEILILAALLPFQICALHIWYLF